MLTHAEGQLLWAISTGECPSMAGDAQVAEVVHRLVHAGYVELPDGETPRLTPRGQTLLDIWEWP